MKSDVDTWVKTVVQRDQYELFAEIRARFADLGTIGKISFSLASAVAFSVVSILLSTAEDFWLRPALMSVRWAVIGLFVFVVLTECVRSMRWTDRKDVFASAHMLAIVGSIVVVIWMLQKSDLIAQIRSDEARSRAAAEECQRQRSEEIEQATKRETDARSALSGCKMQFEETKTVFTSTTVEMYCKSRYAALNSAAQELKTANAYLCPPTETGSLPTHH